MSENPYASPAIPADLATESAAIAQMKVASQGKRFLNLIIDNILMQILSAVAGFILGAVYAMARISANGTMTPEDETLLQVAGFFVGLLVALVYFVFTEALFQRTPAKFLTGTLVVTADGGRPTFGQIVGRSCARFIPFEAFSFFGGKQPVGWHDSLSGTRVIDIRQS